MLCQKRYRRTFETRLRLFRRSARRTGAKLCLGNGLANGSFRPGLTQWAKDSKELKPKPYSGASANTGSIRGAVSERVYLKFHLGPEFRRKLRLKADAVPHARGHRQDDVIKRSPVAP